MIGLRKINNFARITNAEKLVKVPLKDGTTILMQLNEKKQKLDCVVINGKQYITEEHAINSKTPALMPIVSWYMDIISKSMEYPKSKLKVIAELFEKAVK